MKAKEITMTDDDHRDALRAAKDVLNAAIGEAVDAGLIIRADLVEITRDYGGIAPHLVMELGRPV